MNLLHEVAVSSDGSGAISVWEPKGGTLLMSYKGASVLNPQAFCLLGNDYVLGVEKGKPMIHAWPVNSQEKAQLRLICPGRITSMEASPDTMYIAVTVETKLHVWQISSGRLLATASSHYQPITVVKWSADSSFIVTGGEDGNVIVWQLSRLICKQTVAFGIPNSSTKGVTGLTEPLHVKSQHSLPVTHVTLSQLGAKSRVATVSHDRTCKIFDLCTGEDLLSLILDTRLTCVAFDTTEDNIYLGTSDGPIKSVSLRQVPRTRDHHIQDSTASPDFIGHEKQVSSVSVSITGLTLLSSSLDESVKIWHTISRQCLRTIQHKGPVFGAFLHLMPPAIHDYDFNPKVLLKSFDKTLEGNADLTLEVLSMDTLSADLDNDLHSAPTNQIASFSNQAVTDQTVSTTTQPNNNTSSASDAKSDSSLQIEIDKLKKINKSLYEFCVKNVLHANPATFAGLSNGVAAAGKKKNKGRQQTGEDVKYREQQTKQLGFKGRKKNAKKNKSSMNGGKKLNFDNTRQRVSTVQDLLNFK
uniref:WD repeat-containing protein 18 n=1 Tax=Cacopsylla melanoneura TaxID=428564 RepID=A0A8D8ZPG3_9HEMI